MHINLLELWGNMPLPVKSVVILLTLQAIACVAVVIDRLVLLQRSRQAATQFAAAIAPQIEAGAYQAIVADAAAFKANHLASYFEVGLRTYLTRLAAGDDVKRASELAKRALDRRGDAVSREINRGMNVLASTGSTAPFVGLLGTVLGILNAFKLLSQTGSSGIGTIGGAIAEALIVTGYGLVVAIPTVLVFNWISGRIADYEAGLLNAGSELVDRLETSPDPRVQQPMVAQQYEQPAAQYAPQHVAPQHAVPQQHAAPQQQPATRSGLPPRTIPSRLR